MDLNDEEEGSEVYFKWLDGVRNAGSINMFGVVPHLQRAFVLSRKDAVKITAQWMRTYDGRHPE